MKATFITLLSAATSVMGHGFVQEFLIGGQRYTGSLPFYDQYQKPAPDRITQPFWENGNSFVDDVTSVDITCNKGSKPAKLVAKAPAGSEVKFFWTAWPDSHKGPVITYLADCGGDCTTAIGSQLNWFKIDEAGLLADGTWAADALLKNNNTWSLTLPSKIKNGQYLMRHEIVALHAAHELKGAQFYPSCTNIEITGATGENTPETVKIPGAYSASDPGIFINIYYPKVTNYTIPGPALYKEDGTSPAGPTSAPPPPTLFTTAPTLFQPITATYETFVPTDTQGVFPSGNAPSGTAGIDATATSQAAPVPDATETPILYPTETEEEPEPEETEIITTTIYTTIAGQSVTLTAVYTTTPPPGCDAEEPEEPETTYVPAPTVEPVGAVCSEMETVTVTGVPETVTVTDSVTITVTATPVPEPTQEPPVTSIEAVPTQAPTTTSAPVAIPPTYTSNILDPISTDLPPGFSVIPFPTETPATVKDVPTATSAQPYEPSGTGAPLTGYESALTRRDCDDAFMKCQRSFEGCMKRAKRSGMQTRSCEKFKRDVCVEGLRGCDAKIWGYAAV
ncbi:hypothetical protein H072_10914 [Dactylellina haptotyla CBS 200.50]|uniref:lytic cellulose monooxygenase (C4-dehydrogenating) n=1 Tax=Dactylellina haptotyla (strain CBS 200.50) TaxID=1284197 RepID=S8BKA1_DACHA|nr:hypothetical protein H072_10914 [Dactylellina haptotyla CBS 200.50]